MKKGCKNENLIGSVCDVGSIYIINRESKEPDRNKFLHPVLKTLGFDPKTADPAPCWPWPGRLNARLDPVIKGNRRPLRLLVEYVNNHPLPLHPKTGRPLHLVRGCPLHKQCVNPYHVQQIQVLRDNFETIKTDPSYGYPAPLRYLWPEEFKILSAENDHNEDELRILAPCNFYGSPPLP